MKIVVIFILSIASHTIHAQDQQQRLTKVAEQLDADGMEIHADAADKVASMMLQTATAVPTYGYLGRKIEELILECKNVVARKSCSTSDCDRVEKLKEDICKRILDKKFD